MIHYRLADLEDNNQLLELTKSVGMPGVMTLRIDRNPNFFKINKLRGKTNVYVALDKDKIVGSICVSDQTVYIEGKEFPFYYISDFKVARTHRKGGIGLQLTNEVVKYLETQDADFAFLNVAKGNNRPFVFFSNRGNYPDFQNIGTFTSYEYIGAKPKSSKSILKVEKVAISDDLLSFLNRFYLKYQLARVITEKELEDTTLYGIREDGHLRGVMALIDTMSMKQNVVLKMPFYLKVIVNSFNFLGKIFKLAKLPKENESIKMLYIKYLAVEDYDKENVSLLIAKAKECAFNKSYSFVSISLHENDLLKAKLPKFLRFTFKSVGMLVSMKDSQDLMEKIKKGMPYRDYSII